MGHNVGKAADIATQKGMASKKTEERSTDKVILDIRANRAAKLHISATDMDVLLAEYDKALTEIIALNAEVKTLTALKSGDAGQQEHDVIMREITGH